MEKLYKEICSGLAKIRRYSADEIEKIVRYNDAKLECKIESDENYNYCDAMYIKKTGETKYIHIIDTGIGIEITLYMQTKSCVNNPNQNVKCSIKHIKIGSYFVGY